jgi:hypothetical protein
MTIADLGAIGALVSGVAVVISLIYLSLQVRQASKHQRSLLLQGRAQANVDLQMRLAGQEFAPIWENALGFGADLSLSEYRQIRNVCMAGFLRDEEAFLQHRDGLISEAAFEGVKRMAVTMFRFPRPRVTWKQTRLGFDPEFARFMDRLVEETELVDTPATLAAFNRLVAEETNASKVTR